MKTFTKVEGINGQGKTVFIVTSLRTGSEGQEIRWTTTFLSEKEADSWIKYS